MNQPKTVKLKHLKAANRYESLLGFIDEFTKTSEPGSLVKDLVELIDKHGIVSDEVLQKVAQLQSAQTLHPGLFGQLTILNREVRDLLAGMTEAAEPPDVTAPAEEVLDKIEEAEEVTEAQVEEFLAGSEAETEPESPSETPEEPETAPSEPETAIEAPSEQSEVIAGPISVDVTEYQAFGGYPMSEDEESYVVPLKDPEFRPTLETRDEDGKAFPRPPEQRFNRRTKALTFFEVVSFRPRTRDDHLAAGMKRGLDAKSFDFQWSSFAGTDWHAIGWHLVGLEKEQYLLMAARP
jgi:hypothetical protein